ncbi:MAG: hypothetical protein V8K32_10885 [Candidatus Electrothrix gigas]
MKDVEFSNNGEEGTDCPTILPEQFIVTKKELDPAVYEQFLAMLEQGFPAINYEELVPLDVAIGEVIEDSITRLNQGDARVRQEYLATNVAVPTEKEILAFLGG